MVSSYRLIIYKGVFGMRQRASKCELMGKESEPITMGTSIGQLVLPLFHTNRPMPISIFPCTFASFQLSRVHFPESTTQCQFLHAYFASVRCKVSNLLSHAPFGRQQV